MLNFSEFSKKLFDDKESVMESLDLDSLSEKEKIIYNAYFIKKQDIGADFIEILMKAYNRTNKN